MNNPTILPVWNALQSHRESMESFSLRNALMEEGRFEHLSRNFQGMLFDFSKHLVTPETIKLLLGLVRETQVEEMRRQMVSGEKINNTEGRSVLHIACRAPASETILVDGENVVPFVHQVLAQMETFTKAVRSGEHKGHTGKAITDIVNIGIGGSDLGPRYVVEALQDYCSGLRVHFVSNLDEQAVFESLNPETTLFIVASKTFTTEETMLNAEGAKKWLLQTAPSDAVAKHFVALSTNLDAVEKFGINKANMFPFRDWVGGRYSLWSVIGLSISLAVGFDNFKQLLSGARAMDEHFISAPPEENIPLLMGVLGVWYRNFYKFPAHALLPYDSRLKKIAKFTQQMDMESNGKDVDRDGQPINYETGPVVFGEAGTDCQHSFMQLVHQSHVPIPADFVLCKKSSVGVSHAAQLSMASNFLAQTRALAIGQTLAEAGGDASRVFTGNRPTTSIILPELSPFYLGALIAAYEHKVFVQGVIWNLNSYDQPGVELGKILAKPIRKMLDSRDVPSEQDCSTKGLAGFILNYS